MSKERLIKKLQTYVKAYKEPPYGREVEGTVELLEETVKKLAEYEDLEEQGRLIITPIAVGDMAYHVIEDDVVEPPVYISEHEIMDVSANAVYFADDWWRLDEMAEMNAFLSKSEAEEKLRELTGETRKYLTHRTE